MKLIIKSPRKDMKLIKFDSENFSIIIVKNFYETDTNC